MEIKDNREEIRKNKEVSEKKAEVCRVCGCKTVHSPQYNYPTMSCIVYLRGIIEELKEKVSGYEWEKYPERMGK